MDITVLPDAAAVAERSARRVARRLRTASRERGCASFAVSGGSTPAAMFDALVGLDVPWHLVHVLQVDERLAPDGHADRNATQLDEHLVSPLRAAGREIGRVELLPVADTSRAESWRAPSTIDVVHLGLGDDGHTASWVPGWTVPDDADLAVTPEYRGRVRLTLTPRVVNRARWRVVVATGAAKADAVANWSTRTSPSPIDLVCRTGTSVILDTAAAGSVGAWT